MQNEHTELYAEHLVDPHIIFGELQLQKRSSWFPSSQPEKRDLRIDPGDIGQPVGIENTKPPIMKFDNPILLQPPQDAIDVDGSKARGISDVFLGQGSCISSIPFPGQCGQYRMNSSRRSRATRSRADCRPTLVN